MSERYLPLAQHKGTGWVEEIYKPEPGENVVIREIRIVNPTGSVGSVQIYHRTDGSIPNQNVLDKTVIGWVATLSPKQTYTDKAHICMDGDTGGTIAVATSVGLVTTLYGVVIT
jgi:hypothetical protein